MILSISIYNLISGDIMPISIARFLNFLFIFVVGGILISSLVIQLFLGELPCPLCMLQRLAFVCMLIGAVLNLNFGMRTSHYGIILISALFGMAGSVRQILLHIVPGTGNYGAPIWGYHMYTWAGIAFFCSLVFSAIMLLQERTITLGMIVQQRDKATRYITIFAITLSLTLVVLTFAECGLGQCPDNPTRYWLFE
ncbi:hypothetical membrane protein [Desulfotalea psychrophila LSv54]|uniref:Hypothetical membrane protein n=2 Tax=Desulfotalea psychrophila TaxID=84980 RepID=Q6AKG6_DESPS|nr:hypothetical membrane protein [Desulfotalea psychrophila LSv54]